MNQPLHNRVALITGAGRGVGREHALHFASLGAKVVVNDNGATNDGTGQETNPAQDVVDEIRARGGEAVAHLGSVTDWDTGKEMVDLAVGTFGSLDILVNNAGILRDRTLVNMSEDEWDLVQSVHLKGHFVPLRHAAAYWRDRAKSLGGENLPDAAVVNTASGSGLRGNPGQVNYASAKAGIAAMSLVAAQELQRYGVRVNAIAPIARTRLTLAAPGISELMAAKEGTFDKFAPENISPLVAWLSGAECQVSGQVFTVVGDQVGWEQGWTPREQFRNGDQQWTQEQLTKALASLPAGPTPFRASV